MIACYSVFLLESRFDLTREALRSYRGGECRLVVSRGCRLDDEHRERISAGLRRYHERRRRERRVMPRDLHELRTNGSISPSVRPFVRDGEQECRELTQRVKKGCRGRGCNCAGYRPRAQALDP